MPTAATGTTKYLLNGKPEPKPEHEPEPGLKLKLICRNVVRVAKQSFVLVLASDSSVIISNMVITEMNIKHPHFVTKAYNHFESIML